MELKPLFSGTIMEVKNCNFPSQADYYQHQTEIVNIFTGEARRYRIIDGKAWVLGYMPGTKEFIPNAETTIWGFPN